jgi:crotonobetainyl-CoA:carnitine CoA-transferase CaiB-like acyl-CoA transferase
MEFLTGQRFAVESYTVAAAYAAWLLRQYGADVEHVSRLDLEGIGAFLGEGAKSGAEPRVEPLGKQVLITDAPVSAGTRARLESVARVRMVIWITPWGLDAEWAERPWTDLTLQAAGGWMHAVGDPGREPLAAPNSQALLTAGLFAAIAALSRHARVSPDAALPGLVDVSMAEAVLATTIYDAMAFQYHGITRARVSNRFAATQPTIVTLRCKDGYIGLHAALHRQWLRLCELVGHPELVTDARFANPLDRAANIVELDTYLLPWLAERTRFEAYHELQAAGIPASPHPTIPEVLASPQLAARDWWQRVRTPGGREYCVPGPPARVVAEQPARTNGHAAGPWEPGKVRVLDFAMGWAGPLVSHILASYGADVIKVESHKRFDWWRGSRPPGDDPTVVLHERSHVFNAANRGKRGVTLDLTTERGRQLAIELASTADVLIENYAAGVMERFGLPYSALSAKNPRLIMLRQPAFGATGPEASYLAFGNTVEGLSGLSALIGYEGGPPMMMSSAFGDPVNGLNGAVAVLAALAGRERDGKGRCMEAAQLEAFLPMVSEAVIEYQRTGREAERAGNARPTDSPCAAFPCAGADQWITIHVQTDEQWAALAGVIGESWASSADLALGSQRVHERARLESVLAEWTAKRQRDELVETLMRAGVPAAAVNGEADVLSCEPFSSAGFFQPQDRAVVGMHLYPSLAIRSKGERALTHRPAPTLGEHNDEVFRGMGMSAVEIDTLRTDGIIGEHPA